MARVWNETLLFAIRHDYARPTAHARNLFHASAAMYDVWAIYNPPAQPYFLGQTQPSGLQCDITDAQRTAFIAAPKNEEERKRHIEIALTSAVYHLMSHRFEKSPRGTSIRLRILDVLKDLDIPINHNQMAVLDNPEGLGSYLAKCIIKHGLSDGSNEANDYKNTFYRPVNVPLEPAKPGNPSMRSPDRWQPLELENFADQSGNPAPMPEFLSPELSLIHISEPTRPY